MNSEQKKIESNKKEDAKKMPLFALVCVLSGLFGGVVGLGLIFGRDKIAGVYDAVINNTLIIGTVSGFLCLIVGIVLFLATVFTYSSAKKLWDDEKNRDDNWDLVESKLGIAGILSSVHLISVYILFGMTTYNLFENTRKAFQLIDDGRNVGYFYLVIYAVCTAALFVFIFTNLEFNKRIINLEKVINPEKKGSVFDFKFVKKWQDSFDEAEIRQAGIAAMKAFHIVNRTCLVAFVVLTLVGMVVKITIFPLLILGILWLVQIISFGVESMKMSGPNSGAMR